MILLELGAGHPCLQHQRKPDISADSSQQRSKLIDMIDYYFPSFYRIWSFCSPSTEILNRDIMNCCTHLIYFIYQQSAILKLEMVSILLHLSQENNMEWMNEWMCFYDFRECCHEIKTTNSLCSIVQPSQLFCPKGIKHVSHCISVC